jgi:UDP-N-acetylmuramyl pentapeptide synthase
VWLWQVKEYRIDRMRAYLKDEKNILSKNIFYLVALFLILTFYFSQQISIYLALLFFTFSFYQILTEIKKRSFKRPKLTFKVMLIFSIMVIFYCLVFTIYWIPPESISGGMTEEAKFPIGSLASGVMTKSLILLLLFIYIITPILITTIVLFTNPFFNFQKRRIIRKAAQKMKGLKKVKVIGITGSYGKTSTKEFLYAILSQKYKVVKTEENNNTNIGVAYTALNKVSDDYDYFICEMGAYKIGEIAEICSIVNPEIGILTGINEQHIDLFGSIENTIKAKFELIESLPESGLAVINSKLNPEYSGQNSKPQLKTKNLQYFSLSDVENIKIYQDHIEFDYPTISNPSLSKGENEKCHSEFSSESIGDYNSADFNSLKSRSNYIEKYNNNKLKILKQVQDDKDDSLVKFKVNILGRHYIENLLSAIIVAEYLGMSLDEIAEAIEKIKPTEFMMRKITGLNNSVFIDDSYSANPDGVMAALDYLDGAYKDYKKIIVFPGIIELGKDSKKIHKKLFDKIGKICDTAYILNTKYQILNTKNKCKFVFNKDFDKVANMLNKRIGYKDANTQRLQSGDWSQQRLDKNTVILFESRGARIVLNKLLNSN